MLLDVGFQNSVNADKIIAIGQTNTSPAIKAIRHAKEEGRAIDFSMGKKKRSVIYMESGDGVQLVLSYYKSETLKAKMNEAMKGDKQKPMPFHTIDSQNITEDTAM